MPLATGPSLAPTTVYYVEDDTGTAAGALAGQTGASSGVQLCAEFTATSAANALVVAYLIATAMQRPVRLVTKYGNFVPPWTLVLNGPPAIALTACPTGTSY